MSDDVRAVINYDTGEVEGRAMGESTSLANPSGVTGAALPVSAARQEFSAPPPSVQLGKDRIAQQAYSVLERMPHLPLLPSEGGNPGSMHDDLGALDAGVQAQGSGYVPNQGYQQSYPDQFGAPGAVPMVGGPPQQAYPPQGYPQQMPQQMPGYPPQQHGYPQPQQMGYPQQQQMPPGLLMPNQQGFAPPQPLVTPGGATITPAAPAIPPGSRWAARLANAPQPIHFQVAAQGLQTYNGRHFLAVHEYLPQQRGYSAHVNLVAMDQIHMMSPT